MSSSNKRLLIFDLDGTLIDSVPDLADAINTMLTALGKKNYPLETIRHWVGNGAQVLIQRALVGDINLDTPNSINQLTQTDLNHAETLFLQAYTQTQYQKTQPYQGVDQGLQQLHANGFILTLVTNKPSRFLPAILKSFAWERLFTLTLGGDSLPVKKPDPTPLLHICQTLNIAPQQAYMIGDSKNDILAGHNAQIDTLGLSYGYNYGQDIRDYRPAATFDDFPALVDYILSPGTN